MRDLAALRDEARHAYERGRLRAALRVAAVIVPLTALCMLETRSVVRSAIVGCALLTLAVAIRWRQRHGFQVVSAGLHSGVLPLGAALALCRFAPSCPPDVALGLCGGAGVLSGVLAGRSMGQIAPHWQQSLGAGVVAGLTAALGCLAFGIGIASGASVAVAAGVLVGARLPTRATA